MLNLQSWSNANDIKDFEIEGISVGDNLLDHADTIGITIKDIKSYKLKFFPKSKKFGGISFKNKGNFKTFEAVQFTIDPKNYKIYDIGGKIRKPFRNNLSACYKKMDTIFDEIKPLFPNAIIKIGEEKKHQYDKTGKSLSKTYYLKLNSGDITIRCTDWSRDIKIPDSLIVSIRFKEFSNWVNNEAY
jgi:hypothetical protein